MKSEQNLPRPPFVAIAAALSLSMMLTPLGLYAEPTDGIADYRTIDGFENNPDHPFFGVPESNLLRLTYTAYGDGTDSPRGVFYDTTDNGIVEIEYQDYLPSARIISNLVHDQEDYYIPSARGLNQLFFQFGQFLSHDTGLSEPKAGFVPDEEEGTVGGEEFNIEIPADDPDFTGDEISLSRTVSYSGEKSGTGYREQINTITAFIDGSNIYGSHLARSNALRTFSGGKMKTQAGPDGDLLPYNYYDLENASSSPVPPESLFAAGDVRANEQIGLIAFHTLFVREHNRLAEEIYEYEFYESDPDDVDIDEEIFQRARACVGAILQKIAYYEWLPALLGYHAVDDYYGFDSELDPQIANEFSTAAFRLGHTMLPSVYSPTDEYGDVAPIALQDAFFNPSYIASNGISAIIRGQAANVQQEIDRFIVDDVRNFLFGPGFGGLDLASLNIQRGRDHGIPSYNEVRSALGLDSVSDYLYISSDEYTVDGLSGAYGPYGVDYIDLWTGGLCEDHLPYSSLGDTFTAIFKDQFYRLRHGDRFYFENTGVYPPEFIEKIKNTGLADIIRRNTSLAYDDVNDYVFFLDGYGPDDSESYYTDLTLSKKQFSGFVGYDYYSTNPKEQHVKLRSNPYTWAKSYFEIKNEGGKGDYKKIYGYSSKGRLINSKVFENEFGNRTNISAAMKSGTYEPYLEPSNNRHIEVRVKPKRAHVYHVKKAIYTVHCESAYDPYAADSGRAKIKFKH